MPQINQLTAIFFSQLFWLLVVFGIIYFVISIGMSRYALYTERRLSTDFRR